MGSEEHKEMKFWTKEEYKKFAFEMMDKPVSFYAFEMLYWCGIREGELLALTAADFNFDKETVTINKSYQRLHGEDVITTPKTKKSNRTIKMPKFLCEEMQEYLGKKLGGQIEQKQAELKVLSDRIGNYDKGLEDLSDLEVALDTSPKYQLPEPQGFMTAKTYRTKVAEPLVKKLKSLLKTVLARCFEGWDNYYRLNTTNRNLYQSNERLKNHNKQLTADNNRLREEIKDYKLLRKVFGSRQIDSLLEQARQSKQRSTRFRNKKNER